MFISPQLSILFKYMTLIVLSNNDWQLLKFPFHGARYYTFKEHWWFSSQSDVTVDLKFVVCHYVVNVPEKFEANASISSRKRKDFY